MTSEDYEDILYNHRILQWSARILETIYVVFLFYLGFSEFGEELNHHSPSPILTLKTESAVFYLKTCKKQSRH